MTLTFYIFYNVTFFLISFWSYQLRTGYVWVGEPTYFLRIVYNFGQCVIFRLKNPSHVKLSRKKNVIYLLKVAFLFKLDYIMYIEMIMVIVVHMAYLGHLVYKIKETRAKKQYFTIPVVRIAGGGDVRFRFVRLQLMIQTLTRRIHY